MLASISKFSVVIAVILLGASGAMAYPWAIQHGYTTCMTCHYSPSGAGALTNYGKFVGGELFGRYNDSSTALPWLRNPTVEDKFEKKFFSQNVDWILGMQGRVVQTYFDEPTVVRGDPRLMQFDIEAGFSLDKVFGVIQVGARGAQVASGQKPGDLETRQYYVGARDINFAFRAGKFFPEFGIRYPNHNIPTRKGLFFNHNEEPLLVQYSHYFDSVDVNLGYLEGQPKTVLADKKGLVGTLVYRTGHTRSGVSHLSVSDANAKVETTSVYSAFAFPETVYVLVEHAQMKTTTKGVAVANRKDLSFIEAGWEFTKGLISYVNYQRTAFVDSKFSAEYSPVGVKFYPYTHLEINVEAGPTRMVSGSGSAALMMVHWYF